MSDSTTSELQFNAKRLSEELRGTRLADWSEALANAVIDQGHALKHGHLPRWEAAVAQLPACAGAVGSITDEGVVDVQGSFSDEQQLDLTQALRSLMPWRKGPFRIGPCFIDTEWRSDWKWNRVLPHLQPLAGRVVLDVGCGSGYHLWRMRDAGARQVLGIDPSLLYLKQFDAFQHYLRDSAVQFLPLPMEAMPPRMEAFDTVFSMGVLYHRRQPDQHMKELQQALCRSGELVLETLVVPTSDGQDTGLTIEGRYANMRNIYELPSIARLERWIAEAGFIDVKTVSVDITTTEEQRTTEWMSSYSLAQALDPADDSLTIEGYPRPCRAVVVANRA